MLFLTMTTIAAAIVHAAPIAGADLPATDTSAPAGSDTAAAADSTGAATGAGRVGANDDLILRRYELSDLDVVEQTEEWIGWGLSQDLVVPVIRGEDFEIAFDEHEVDEYMDFESFVFELLGEETEELGVSTLRLTETGILVSASERGHAYVAEQLAAMRRLRTDDARLAISRWTVDELPDDVRPGLVSSATAAAWIEKLADGGEGTTRHVVANGHRNTRIASGARADVLVDMHLEIAQGGAVLDPEVRRIATGVNGAVRAAPGDGGWHVALQLTTTDATRSTAGEELTISMAVASGAPNLGGLFGGPVVRTTSVATDAFVPDGRALVVVEESADDATVTIVSALGGDSAILRTIGDTRVVELGAALHPRVFALRSDLELNRRAPGPISLGGSWDEANLFVCGLESTYVDSLYDPLSVLADVEIRRLEEQGDDSAEQAYEVFELVAEQSWRTGPTFGAIVVPTRLPWIGEVGSFGAAFCERGAELVRALAPARSNHQLRVRLTEAGDVIHEFHVPMRVGSTTTLVDMTEELVVVDFDVEVAENCAAVDPQLRPSASGVCLTLRMRGREGALMLDAAGSWQREERYRSNVEHALIEPIQSMLVDGELFEGVRALRPGETSLWGDVTGRGVRLEVELVD